MSFIFAAFLGLLAVIIWRNIVHQRELKQMTPEQLRAFREEERIDLQIW